MKGANWRHPYGPKSNINALDNHPVVHVVVRRRARLRAMGRQGIADRGGVGVRRARRARRRRIAWGDEFTPGGRHMANTWQGEFPRQNLDEDGFERTSPVTAFPPNGYGVHDMIGNVWEWTTDWYSPKHEADAPKACCIPENPRGGREDASYDPLPAGDQDSAQGDQGRLASLRAELLPPLSAGRASRRAGRHVDQPSRISVRRRRERLMHRTRRSDVMTEQNSKQRPPNRRRTAANVRLELAVAAPR